MSNTLEITQSIVGDIAGGKDPKEIALAFSEDLQFRIQGDEGALPWIGSKSGRKAIIEFLSRRDEFVEPIAFNVEDILANDTRGVILGNLSSKVKVTERIINSSFAIILTIAGNAVIRFEMLEDSFAVSRAAR